MPLPASRNKTYSGGEPIVPDDLNSIQDEIIAQYGRWSAKQTWNLVLSSKLDISGTWSSTVTGAPNGTGKLTINASSAETLFGLALPIGGKLDGFNLRCQDGAAATVLVGANLQSWDDSGNAIFNSTVKVSAGTGAKQTVSDSNVNHVVTEGRYYLRVFLSGGGAGTRTIWHASYSFYLPL